MNKGFKKEKFEQFFAILNFDLIFSALTISTDGKVTISTDGQSSPLRESKIFFLPLMPHSY